MQPPELLDVPPELDPPELEEPLLAPKLVAPESLAPERVAPELAAPEAVPVPESVAPLLPPVAPESSLDPDVDEPPELAELFPHPCGGMAKRANNAAVDRA